MGVITDFIVANKKDAKKICIMDLAERNKYHSEAIRGLYKMELEALYCVLKGVEYETPRTYKGEQKFLKTIDRHFPLLFKASDGGPWIYGIPDKFISLLAALESRELTETCNQWIETAVLNSWKDTHRKRINRTIVKGCIRRLRDLAVEAKEQKLGMLMWICL